MPCSASKLHSGNAHMSIGRFCLIATAVLGSDLQAQSFSFGIKGGVPFTSAVEGIGPSPAAKRYTVGPMVEIGLPFSFAFEADGLYRRTGYDAIAGNLGTVSNSRVRANSWEFPLLAKSYSGPKVLPAKIYAT